VPLRSREVLARTAIACGSVLGPAVLMLALGGFRGGRGHAALAVLGLGAGTVVGMIRPARGLQDRLAGMWLAPG
jgi:hypothetical protein